MANNTHAGRRLLLLAMFNTLVFAPVAFSQDTGLRGEAYMSFCQMLSHAKDSIYAVDSLNSDKPIVYDLSTYKLFMPPILYSAPIRQRFMPSLPAVEVKPAKRQPLFESYTKLRPAARDSVVNNMLLSLYMTKFDISYVRQEVIDSYASYEYDGLVNDAPVRKNVFDLFKPMSDYNEDKRVDSRISVRKPNFWTTEGSSSVQFSQNYISPNWYNGGESVNTILAYLMLSASYNDKSKIEFDNKLEVRVGFITVPSDTLHKYNFNSDLLRFTSKLGIKAYSKWYYTLSMEFNTQFFNSYDINSPDRLSSFMSPGNLVINLGMDYKLNKTKATLSVLLSPLTYNFRYVGDPLVDETSFGLDEGSKVLNSFGSTLQLNLKWTIIPSIVWESRFNYFTSYKKIESEWENTFNFILNRYLSAKLFVHARYYDLESDHKVQLNEMFSFGVNYSW